MRILKAEVARVILEDDIELVYDAPTEDDIRHNQLLLDTLEQIDQLCIDELSA